MINKQRFWLITATTKNHDATKIWEMTKQLPAFIIDTEIQGLVNMMGLNRVVMDIIGAGGQYVAEPFDISA